MHDDGIIINLKQSLSAAQSTSAIPVHQIARCPSGVSPLPFIDGVAERLVPKRLKERRADALPSPSPVSRWNPVMSDLGTSARATYDLLFSSLCFRQNVQETHPTSPDTPRLSSSFPRPSRCCSGHLRHAGLGQVGSLGRGCVRSMYCPGHGSSPAAHY